MLNSGSPEEIAKKKAAKKERFGACLIGMYWETRWAKPRLYKYIKYTRGQKDHVSITCRLTKLQDFEDLDEECTEWYEEEEDEEVLLQSEYYWTDGINENPPQLVIDLNRSSCSTGYAA